MPRAAIIASELTRLARMFAGSDDVRVYHDFSGLEALNESRSEIVNRVNLWWAMGVDLPTASTLEGVDLPAGIDVDAALSDEDDAAARAVLRLVEQEAYRPPVTEAERGAVWRGLIKNLHKPYERRLAMAMRRFLRGQAKRIAKRMVEVLQRDASAPVTRQVRDSLLKEILNFADESARMNAALRPIVSSMLRRSFNESAKRIRPEGLTIDPTRFNRIVENEMASLIVNVEPYTRRVVRTVIRDAHDAGATMGNLQLAILEAAKKLPDAPAFSAARALRISRTETTRSLNAGAQESYKAAADAGIEVEIEWLSARDDAVRDEHANIDGQTGKLGGRVVTATGDRAEFPGDFGVAALDINCRCTTLPIVKG